MRWCWAYVFLIVLTTERQPQAGEVRASIFVTSPVAKAMLRSSKNSCAVARTPAAMSLDDRGSGAEWPSLTTSRPWLGLKLRLNSRQLTEPLKELASKQSARSTRGRSVQLVESLMQC